MPKHIPRVIFCMKRFIKWFISFPDYIYTNTYVLIAWRILALFMVIIHFFRSYVPNLISSTWFIFLILTICICSYESRKQKKVKKQASEEQRRQEEYQKIKKKRDEEGIANCEEWEVYW